MAKEAKWGAIFDWDGVIIDSSPAHEESWERLAAEESLPLPPGHFKRGFGQRNVTIIPEILEWSRDAQEIARLGDRKETLYREILAEMGLTPLPGAREWLEQLQAAGIPCAIGSSTARANIDLALEETGLAPFFSSITTAEDVTHGKPHPEVFLNAATGIGMPPERCVVFEDAFAGIEAAQRGGMRVIGVASTHSVDVLAALPRPPDVIVTRLDTLSLTKLVKWFED